MGFQPMPHRQDADATESDAHGFFRIRMTRAWCRVCRAKLAKLRAIYKAFNAEPQASLRVTPTQSTKWRTTTSGDS